MSEVILTMANCKRKVQLTLNLLPTVIMWITNVQGEDIKFYTILSYKSLTYTKGLGRESN